jgi:Ser/Thr protein kinase RdoA (MazF antagonist)
MTAGAPDRRIERLPALLDDVLLSRPLPLDADQRTAIEAARTDIERTDFRVSALDHSDMHDNNVLVGHGSPRIIDWGDSCVTHPFASLFVVYQHMVARCRADIRRDLALRLRDVYLDAWRDEAPAEVLRRSFAHALWLGYVIRALNFVHMNEAGYEDLDRDVAQFLVRWSQKHSLLNDPDEIVAAIANETEY